MLTVTRAALPPDVRKGSAFPIALITFLSVRLSLADELTIKGRRP
jgi:hypothetical protein